MKILMICGSPRTTDSNSMYLLKALSEKLGQQNKITFCETSKGDEQCNLNKIAANICSSEVIVLAFPLYVDGIPSHLLGILKGIESANMADNEHITVYQIANSGFYDARQNHIAIDMIWNWCDKCGMKKGCSLGVGAGEMSQAAPVGHGPSVNLGKGLDQLAADILAGKTGGSVFIEPNFPRFLYKAAAHIGWRKKAKKNGLKVSELKRRLIIEEHPR